ncbi:SDR family oxidoreductase [Thalassobaculum sp. OXR-137]|uniref:SDR family NAD(P)-dependent oxidoreductase n=1 Tax=Thalassobaculum sp. OXR-137 TaxID=3100173 RepID=UPI002AC98322|nr:SDR family oxidoreductase [Thalassobaculum sp. OXR-137]WPZ36793.1 SDR family oxidoreductase [Thalassobaculum sp. OXR-137]
MTQKVAIVTGAARGIGLAVSRRFLSEGWQVLMVDIEAEALLAAQDGLGTDDAVAQVCDVSDPVQVRRVAAVAMERFGRIDAVVNNAGIAVFKPLLDTSYEEWSRVLAVNLNGPFLMVQETARLMAETGGGAVVNIGSISGLRASTLRVAYGTSKAALVHLTKQQATELGEIGVRVNLIAPGPVDTAMAKEVHTPVIRADYHDAIPLNRYGLEEEIANGVFFLCSDQASYITGQTLAVDGGFDAAGIGLPTLRRGN